jgi:hypothetical protein
MRGRKSSPADRATDQVAIPQSMRPARIAWAMSGPVGKAGCGFRSSSATPARAR